MVQKLDHIGVAVFSLEKACVFYEKILGLKLEKIEVVESQKVKTAFFRVGDVSIELLEATDSTSPVAKFLEKRGEGVHHLAYAVDDVDIALKDAHNQGVECIHEKSFEGAHSKRVGFLHPQSTMGVLTEFCSKGSQ